MDLLLKQKIQKADLEFRKKQFDEEKESREEQKKWLEENTVNLSKVSNILSQNIAQDLKKDITWATETLEKAKIGLQSRLYVIIDEYDNFANQLITSHQDTLYRELTADNSFLKNFFKTLKSGCKDGTIARTFITGVLPITIDDLASGFNIADFITLEPKFENMMGFTHAETEKLLDDIYRDHEIDPANRPVIMEVITANYNGYRIVNPRGEGLFNSTILMYFLRNGKGTVKLIASRKLKLKKC